MSFSNQVKEELNSIHLKGNCCKKSYLFGALLCAERSEKNISLKISDEETASKVAFLLKSMFNCEPDINKIKRGCFESTFISFFSKKPEDFLIRSDAFSSDSSMGELFKCTQCRSAFLRGVFCSSGSVSDPQKSYTLEIRTRNINRAELIRYVIKTWGITPPKAVERKDAVGIFYRNDSSIEDFLTACGGNNAQFLFYEAVVNKNVRNIENRATNCVTKNISKTVAAASLQISAIESLIAVGAIDELSRDLIYTAQIRLSNPDVNLNELAGLHNPPISKSGLNHRLAKIVDEARKRKLL